MRAGFDGDSAACGSIAVTSGLVPFVGEVEEQAVTASTVTRAADIAAAAARTCFDMKACSLRGCWTDPPETGPTVRPHWMPRILRGLPRQAPDGHGEQNPTCDQCQPAERRQHMNEPRSAQGGEIQRP